MTNDRPSLEHKRIVLVEDDDDVRRSLTLLLRSRGVSVEVYRSGAELLSHRTLPRSDCLLIDYKMPGLNGLELLAKLRQAGLMTPALMITGFFSNTLLSRAKLAGFSDVIEKPPLEQGLLSKIADLVA